MKLSKKALSLFAVAALLVSLLSVMSFTIASAAGENLVVNGDFEDGINNWSTHFGNKKSSASTVAHGGAGGTAHEGWNGDPFFQTVTVIPNTTYTVTYWIKGGGSGSDAAVVEGTAGHSAALYYVFKGENATLATMDITVLGTNKAAGAYSDWTEVSFVVKPTTTSMTLGFGNSGNGAWLWIDDVSIVEGGELPSEDDDDTTDGPLVKNGDFEEGTANWADYWGKGTTKYNIVSDPVHGGEKAMGLATDCWSAMYQEIQVTPGMTYELTAWVKGGGDKTKLWVFEDAEKTAKNLAGNVDTHFRSGLDLAPYSLVAHVLPTDGCAEWTKVSYTFIPTQPSVTLAFCNATTTAQAAIDDISIEAKVDPETLTNAIQNGDFEEGTANWADYWGKGTAKYNIVSDPVHGGEKAMGLAVDCWSAMYQEIQVTPGKTYELTAWVIGGGDKTKLWVFQDAEKTAKQLAGNVDTHFRSGLDLAPFSLVAHVLPTEGYTEWTKVSYTFIPAQPTVTLAFSNGTTTAQAAIDDISIFAKAGEGAAVTMGGKFITIGEITSNSIALSWGAAAGSAAAEDITYSVYVSDAAITKDNIDSLTPFTTVAGTAELKATATGLESGKMYYFAVKAADKFPDAAFHSDAVFAGPARTIPVGKTEMLVNGDFENIKVNGDGCGFCDESGSDYGNWKLITAKTSEILLDDFGANTRKITSTEKHGGSYAVSFRFNSNMYYSLTQKFNVLKGYKYTVSFWYKGDAGAIAGLGDDWNAHSSGNYHIVTKTDANSDWTKYTMVYYPAKDGATRLWLTGPGQSDGGEAIFDDVSVVEEYAPLYFTATSIPVNKITKDSIDISWAAPTVQDGQAAVTGYKVYISENIITADNVASLTPVATVTDKAYTFTGLKANTRYYFAVEATNGTASTYLIDSNDPTYTQKDEAAPSAGTNLIIDGGFDLSESFSDNPREGWHRVNNAGDVFLFWGGVHTDVGDPMKLGSVSVYPWQQSLVQWVQVKPNTTYAYSFNCECYLEDGGPGFRVYERADGKWNGRLLKETKLEKNSGIGTSYQDTFKTGPDTTEVYINPHNAYASQGSGGQCLFDEIYLIEVVDTSLYMLGGMTQVEYGEDYLIVSWPKAQADEEDSKLTYKVYTSDKPITADNIGSLTAFTTVAGDDEYREAELGDLKPGTKHYFAVSVTNSQGKTAYLFSDSAFTTDGDPVEDEGDDTTGGDNTGNDSTGGNAGGNAGGNTGDDSTGGDNAADDNTDNEESTSPVTGETATLLVVALLAVLLSAGVLVFTKRRAHN